MFNELNILKIFFEDPLKEFNVREIARIEKIAPATASSKLKNFAKNGLLKERKERNLLLYKAHMDNEAYVDLKKYYTIRKIRESGLIGELNRFYLKPTISLFGSCAFGSDTKESDIDLVVISEKNKEFPEKERFEKKLGRGLHIFMVKELKDLKNEHLVNNVLNGIVLQGEIKWI